MALKTHALTPLSTNQAREAHLRAVRCLQPLTKPTFYQKYNVDFGCGISANSIYLDHDLKSHDQYWREYRPMIFSINIVIIIHIGNDNIGIICYRVTQNPDMILCIRIRKYLTL